MKKILLSVITIAFIFVLFSPYIAYAQNKNPYLKGQKETVCNPNQDYKEYYTLIPHTGCLADKFRTGYFNLADVLVYIKYATEVLLVLTATASVVMVIYGGYTYLLSFIIEDKEGGKKTITNALIGLTISILAWVLINSVLFILTGPSS